MNTEFGTSLPQKTNAPANAGSTKRIVAALILLSAIPVATGTSRLTQLAGGFAAIRRGQVIPRRAWMMRG